MPHPCPVSRRTVVRNAGWPTFLPTLLLRRRHGTPWLAFARSASQPVQASSCDAMHSVVVAVRTTHPTCLRAPRSRKPPMPHPCPVSQRTVVRNAGWPTFPTTLLLRRRHGTPWLAFAWSLNPAVRKFFLQHCLAQRRRRKKLADRGSIQAGVVIVTTCQNASRRV